MKQTGGEPKESLPIEVKNDLIRYKNNERDLFNDSFIRNNRKLLDRIQRYFKNEDYRKLYGEYKLYKEAEEVFDRYARNKISVDRDDIKNEIDDNNKKYRNYKEYSQFRSEYTRLFDQSKRKNHREFLIEFYNFLENFIRNNSRKSDINKFKNLKYAIEQEFDADINDKERKIILPEEETASTPQSAPPAPSAPPVASAPPAPSAPPPDLPPTYQELQETDDENKDDVDLATPNAMETTENLEIDATTKEPIGYSEDYLTMFHLYNIISLYTNMPNIMDAVTNIKDTTSKINSEVKLHNSLYDILISIKQMKRIKKQHLNYYGHDDNRLYLSATGIMKVAQFIKEQEVLEEAGRATQSIKSKQEKEALTPKLSSEEKKEEKSTKKAAKRAASGIINPEAATLLTTTAGPQEPAQAPAAAPPIPAAAPPSQEQLNAASKAK